MQKNTIFKKKETIELIYENIIDYLNKITSQRKKYITNNSKETELTKSKTESIIGIIEEDSQIIDINDTSSLNSEIQSNDSKIFNNNFISKENKGDKNRNKSIYEMKNDNENKQPKIIKSKKYESSFSVIYESKEKETDKDHEIIGLIDKSIYQITKILKQYNELFELLIISSNKTKIILNDINNDILSLIKQKETIINMQQNIKTYENIFKNEVDNINLLNENKLCFTDKHNSVISFYQNQYNGEIKEIKNIINKFNETIKKFVNNQKKMLKILRI